jgi:glycogen operon protein
MIALRKRHPNLRDSTGQAKCGFPYVSRHGLEPWNLTDDIETRYLGVMFAGKAEEAGDDQEDEIIYVGMNMHWESQRVVLPSLPLGLEWRLAVNTALPAGEEIVEEPCKMTAVHYEFDFEPRSVVIMMACRINRVDSRGGRHK